MRGALVLLTTSAGAAGMTKRRKLSLLYWIHARLFAKGEGNTWVLYYIDDLEELSRIVTGSLNRFISSEWFRN